MSLIRWSHNPQITILGLGNSLRLTVPLYCLRATDELIIQSVVYRSDELHISADILRRPFLSPYLEGTRFEPHERDYGLDFFEKNFNTLNNSKAPPLPQLS